MTYRLAWFAPEGNSWEPKHLTFTADNDREAAEIANQEASRMVGRPHVSIRCIHPEGRVAYATTGFAWPRN